MAKAMAMIIGQKDGEFAHYATHYPHCFCHVLALILGAGLKALKLNKAPKTSTSKPGYFLILHSIAEVEENEDGTTTHCKSDCIRFPNLALSSLNYITLVNKCP
ncbi:hypothetical protein H4Q26_009623 [Puccinia striiformis f. sp. tritici PST-130]|nr:hypothetical protein H4Q26_009623 [Puccinia striiformis f. sp. tritici PST-130]